MQEEVTILVTELDPLDPKKFPEPKEVQGPKQHLLSLHLLLPSGGHHQLLQGPGPQGDLRRRPRPSGGPAVSGWTGWAVSEPVAGQVEERQSEATKRAE